MKNRGGVKGCFCQGESTPFRNLNQIFTAYRMLCEIRAERKIEGDNFYGTIETMMIWTIFQKG